MELLAVLGVVGLVVVLRRRSGLKRLPTLMHDYSAARGVFQRWPGRSRRRFK